jgi:acyl-CoA thioesterase
VTQLILDESWTITGHINGGYLAAVVAEAASEHFDGAPPLTLSAHYLAPARGGGPAEIEIDELRRRRLSTARVRLIRDGTTLVEALVTVGTPKTHERTLDHSVRPPMPAWDDCPGQLPGWEGSTPGMNLLAHLEMRLDPPFAAAIAGDAAAEQAVARCWVTYADGRPADRFLALTAWDVLPPSLWATHLWSHVPTVSAQLVLYPGEIVGPLLVEARSETLLDGICDEVARVWDATGRLVVNSRQTAIVAPAYVPPADA